MTGALAPTTTAASPRWFGGSEHPPLLQQLWRRLPQPLRRRLLKSLLPTGIPFLLTYASNHRRQHRRARFAGRLADLHDEFTTATTARRAELLAQFDAIADALVLPNGVRKTSYTDRPTALLRAVLDDPACTLPDRSLRVLDLPASTGAAALGARSILARTHSVREYVLADLAFHLLYDRERQCVFDADHVLLQVAADDRFDDVYLPHAAGVEASILTRVALAPLSARGRRLRERFRAEQSRKLEVISLLRPDVEELNRFGAFTILPLDVFAPLPDHYDVILSFNLLQQNYFSHEAIARGIENLIAALTPDGLLILGRPDQDGQDAHRVYRRVGDRGVLVRSVGEL